MDFVMLIKWWKIIVMVILIVICVILFLEADRRGDKIDSLKATIKANEMIMKENEQKVLMAGEINQDCVNKVRDIERIMEEMRAGYAKEIEQLDKLKNLNGSSKGSKNEKTLDLYNDYFSDFK